MGKITTKHLPDMQQSRIGFYNKSIEKVGVRNIQCYIPIKMKDGSVQKPIAIVSSYCSLDENTKGINMSRITRTINSVLKEDSTNDGTRDLGRFVKKLAEAHQSPDVYIKAKFSLILDSTTPMTDIYSQEPVDVVLESQYKENDGYRTFLTVESVEKSLCPCSREMSLLKNNLTEEEKQELAKANLSNKLQKKLDLAGFGSHNQKSFIKATIEVNLDDILWIEDLVEMIRHSASCPTFSVLKRPDEKAITEIAYCGGYFDDDMEFNPVEGTGAKFVEDIARDLAQKLDSELDKKVKDFVIVVNNQESIHSGNIEATSVLTAGRNLR